MARNLIVAIACGLASLATATAATAQSASQRAQWEADCADLGGRLDFNTGTCVGARSGSASGGGLTADQQAMLGLASNFGNLLGAAIRQSFVDGQRRAQEEAQRRAFEAEQARQRALAEAEDQRRRNAALIANMKGAIGSPDLQAQQLGGGQLKMRTAKDMFDAPAGGGVLAPGSWSAYYNVLQRRDAAAVTLNARESDLAVADRLLAEAQNNAAAHPGPESARLLDEARAIRDKALRARDAARADLQTLDVKLAEAAAARDKALNVSADAGAPPASSAAGRTGSQPAAAGSPSLRQMSARLARVGPAPGGTILNRGPQYSDPNAPAPGAASAPGSATPASGAADAGNSQQQEVFLGGVRPTEAQIDQALATPDLAGIPVVPSSVSGIASVPSYLPANVTAELTPIWEGVSRGFYVVRYKSDQFDRECPADKESSWDAGCKAKAEDYNAGVGMYRQILKAYRDARDGAAGEFTTRAINAWALNAGWSSAERDRLSQSLSLLGDPNPADPKAEFDKDAARESAKTVWQLAEKLTRFHQNELASAKGLNLAAAGKQALDDCAVYALATATGRSYPEVAARARAVIGEAAWREPDVRNNPQLALEKGGLNGGEVVLLAEEYGQASVVPVSQFASAIAGGKPVLVHVIAEGGGDHEVVLSRTFRSGSETYFEVIDSTRPAPIVISQTALSRVIVENGVAVSR